jgi:hypothetical protein
MMTKKEWIGETIWNFFSSEWRSHSWDLPCLMLKLLNDHSPNATIFSCQFPVSSSYPACCESFVPLGT